MRRTSRALIYGVPGKRERCPACGTSRLYDLDLLPLRRPVGGCRTGFVTGCDDCGLVFSNPQPTPDWISKGRGRHTWARLRVLAQRVQAPLEPPSPPSDAARNAVRRYHAGIEGRPLLERLGLYRLAARTAEGRRRAVTIRKSGNSPVGSVFT